ncbi:hypothetical protein J7M22_03250 [Candidatus Poribacteria bacterium]|nr:hypothetical protein [Candidatus Poribacteria bacterium]
MKGRFILIGMAIALIFGALGCGGKQVQPPTIKEGSTVIIAPFDSEDKSKEMRMFLPYTIGTQLKLKMDKVNWVFDESDAVSPVGSYLKKKNITPQDIFTSPKLAAEVAKGLNADLIITAHLSSPRLSKREDDRPVYDMTKVGVAGANRYTLLYQRGSIDATVNIIDAKTAEPIWSVKMKGAVKYVRAFQSQAPEKPPVPDKQIISDLRKHLAQRILHALYPNIFPDKPVPELLEKPKQRLIASGGELKFE